MRCVSDTKDESGDALLTAMSSLTSMRRILDQVVTDPVALSEIERIMSPCLKHGLGTEGLCQVAEMIYCVTVFLFHGYKDNKPLS